MKLYVYCFVAILAMAGPSRALLGAKLALLGVLRNSIGGGSFGNSGGYGNGGSYGYGSGYGGGYGGGYDMGYNRPVYTGQSNNYGWGQQSYGGGYGSGYRGGYNGGNEDNVRVIKVIVNHEPDTYYDNYARKSSAAAFSGSSSANWSPAPAPVPAQIPIPQTYAPAPLPIQVQATAPAPPPVQSIQVSAPAPAPVPVQVFQPPPRPIYVQAQPETGYQQVALQRPIQYSVQQPQANFRQTQLIPQPLPPTQPSVSTIKLIVDGGAQHAPAASYGPPAPSTNLLAPSVDSSGAWSSDSWSAANSVGGGAGNGQWKNGGIWESIGC